MYYKLALRNVKKSFKDYLIYFLTLTFSVCLFYTFNSFQSQQAVMQMNESQNMMVDQLSILMNFLSIFVAIVLAFLILYANNFLIRRRKKELAIYTLLGMPRRKISKILVYETLTIGLISLISGMILGLILSQILTAVTANMFSVPLDYHFVFSTTGTIMTLLAFSIIFIITMLFNTVVLNRYKLIDLMNADKKNDELKIKKLWVSIIIFILALICLGWAYYAALHNGVEAFGILGPIILAGSIGTLLFFLSLAGFLLTIVKSNKRIYFKNLNCFILRQINSNINSNFISMSIVCIMLLLSIGALSTGLSLNNTINSTIKNSTPYDFSVIAEYGYYPNGSLRNEEDNLLQDAIKKLDLNEDYIKNQSFITTYYADIQLNDSSLLANVTDKNTRSLLELNSNTNITIIPLSSYNKILEKQDYEPLSLNFDEVYLYTDAEMISKGINQILKAKPEITLYNHKVKINNDSYENISVATSSSINNYILAMVVPDEIIPENADKHEIIWNVDTTNSITDLEFANYFMDILPGGSENASTEEFPGFYYSTKQDIYDVNKGMSVILTYIGIYLGTVFMIASAVILALQQLSQANDNKKRYMILNKLGTEPKMINHSILLQIAIYFMMPLALAIIHSIVGIQTVNVLVTSFGRSDILMSSSITAAIIILVYGSYFLITYLGYKNIIQTKQ